MFILECIKKYAKAGRTAVVSDEGSLSFAELDRHSDAFAKWLLKRFSDSRAPILIYGQKELNFLPCVFGALKAGRAYVPVDFAVPPARAAQIAKDVKPDIIVDFSGAGFWPSSQDLFIADQYTLQSILNDPAPMEIPRENWISGDDIAYILFTSGSAGAPKGVPVTAANLASFYNGLLPLMEGECGVILDQVSYSFDVSCCSIYAGLSRGMTLMSIGRKLSDDIGGMLSFLRTSGLTMWVSTPSFAEICIRAASFTEDLLPDLRTFLFCGEVLTNKLCDQLSTRFPKARILNTYGPTEATVLVTAVYITPEMRRDTRPVPIGYPIEGVTLRLEDESGGEIKTDGESGELLIIGDSVGPGYKNRPDLTNERFFHDLSTGKRGYRTGDICTRENGLYYYQGRRDNQLKLYGHRIEIEDIEIGLTRLDNIAQAAVVPVMEDGRVQYLTAFILLESDDGLTSLKRSIAIKKQAAKILPAYMIPRKFIRVDTFPLNINGKVDKKDLIKRLEGAK